MGPLTAALSIALASYAVSVDGLPLRDGCDAGEPVIAHLQKGDPVDVRFRLAGSGGACFKVSVESGGKTLQGYVSPEGISGTEVFEQGLQSAASTGAPAMLRSDADSIKKAAYSRGGQDPGAQAARLIEANRPNEALRILEPALKTSQEDPGLLSLAGYAAYRGDDMRAAMDYWEKSLMLRPNAAVERLLEKARLEAKEDKSGEKLVGARFLLRYNREQMSSETARRIVTMLDREFARVSQELGCRLDERIVAIVQTPEEYQKTTNAAEWSAGQYNGRIRVSASDQTSLNERTRQIFSHEIVHACLAGLGDFPIWLHEGLAQKLSGETLSPRQESVVRQMANSGQLPKLKNLSQTWARMSSLHASVAYSTSLAAINLFYEHHSGLGARNLLRNPNMLPQIEADLDMRLQRLETSRR